MNSKNFRDRLNRVRPKSDTVVPFVPLSGIRVITLRQAQGDNGTIHHPAEALEAQKWGVFGQTLSISGIVALCMVLFFACADYNLIEKELSPIDLTVTNITDSSVTVSWTKTDAYDFRSYEVRFSTSSVIDSSTPLTDSLKFRNDTSYTFTGLEPEQPYYFRVIATTYRAETEPSYTVTATTLPDLKGKLLFYYPDSITESSVYLRWSPAGNKGFKRYKLFVDTTAQVDSSDSLVKIIHDSTYLVEGLRLSRHYWFIVYAESDTGIVAQSKSRAVTTLSGTPQKSVLQEKTALDSAITVVWSKNVDHDFNRYMLIWDTATIASNLPDTLKITSFKTIEKVSDTVGIIAPVITGKRYYVRLFTIDRTEQSIGSDLMKVQTVRSLPMPLTMSCVVLSDSSVELTWSKASELDFLNYKLYQDTISTITLKSKLIKTISNKDSTKTIVTGLKPKKRYWFSVYSEDTTKLGIFSEVKFNYEMILQVRSSTSDGISLEWSMADVGDFEGYILYRSSDFDVSDKSSSITDIPLRITKTFKDSDVLPGQRYYYRLYSYHKDSNTGMSNIVTETVPEEELQAE